MTDVCKYVGRIVIESSHREALLTEEIFKLQQKIQELNQKLVVLEKGGT
jgi:hypothetical protein